MFKPLLWIFLVESIMHPNNIHVQYSRSIMAHQMNRLKRFNNIRHSKIMTPQTFIQVCGTILDRLHIEDRQNLTGHHDLLPVCWPVTDWVYWTTLEKVQIDFYYTCLYLKVRAHKGYFTKIVDTPFLYCTCHFWQNSKDIISSIIFFMDILSSKHNAPQKVHFYLSFT